MIDVSSTAKLVLSALQDNSVPYQPTTALPGTDIPSSPLSWCLAYPGSDFPQLLSILSPNCILLVAYSKSLQFPIQQSAKLLLDLQDLNAKGKICLWKLQNKEGSCYPLAQMRLFLSSCEESAKTQIWTACGLIDKEFKDNTSKYRLGQTLTILSLSSRVKDFLSRAGFGNIKESAIPHGRSLLVIAANDLEAEGSAIKRFPIKVDITAGIIAFRVYFSMNDAVLTTTEPFRTAVLQLIAQLNWLLPVGYYNFASGSHQLQLTLKLHYRCLCLEDLEFSIKAYYDSVVSGYMATVKAVASLYRQSVTERRSESEAYFLHPISDMNRDFSVLLATYRSKISALSDQENTLIE